MVLFTGRPEFCAQEMEIPCSKMEILHSEIGKFSKAMETRLFRDFSMPNQAIPPRLSQFEILLNFGWNRGGTAPGWL